MSKSMTPERALEVITNTIQAYTMTEEKDIALAVAQKALEMQIPKKVIFTKTEVTFYQCPCCNSFISRSSDFCNKCGQALDWSDEE